jgi:hypothetical protein
VIRCYWLVFFILGSCSSWHKPQAIHLALQSQMIPSDPVEAYRYKDSLRAHNENAKYRYMPHRCWNRYGKFGYVDHHHEPILPFTYAVIGLKNNFDTLSINTLISEQPIADKNSEIEIHKSRYQWISSNQSIDYKTDSITTLTYLKLSIISDSTYVAKINNDSAQYMHVNGTVLSKIYHEISKGGTAFLLGYDKSKGFAVIDNGREREEVFFDRIPQKIDDDYYIAAIYKKDAVLDKNLYAITPYKYQNLQSIYQMPEPQLNQVMQLRWKNGYSHWVAYGYDGFKNLCLIDHQGREFIVKK